MVSPSSQRMQNSASAGPAPTTEDRKECAVSISPRCHENGTRAQCVPCHWGCGAAVVFAFYNKQRQGQICLGTLRSCSPLNSREQNARADTCSELTDR